MTKHLVVDPKRCVDCRTCELMCSYKHTDKFNPREAALTIFDYEEQAVSVPVMCLQCAEASCVKACPTGALSHDENGVVVTHPKKCIVCKLCVSACQLGNIHFSPAMSKMHKCDMCGGGDPQCARYCPTGAIIVVDPTAALDKQKQVADKMVDALEEVSA